MKGMMFHFIEKVMKFYAGNGKQKGVVVSKSTSKMMEDGKVHCMTIACACYGKPKIQSSNITKMHPQ